MKRTPEELAETNRRLENVNGQKRTAAINNAVQEIAASLAARPKMYFLYRRRKNEKQVWTETGWQSASSFARLPLLDPGQIPREEGWEYYHVSQL